MTDLLIRGLDDATHAELKRRADKAGMSLQAYVSRLLAEHTTKPSLGEWLTQLEQLPRHPEISGAATTREARQDLL